MTPLIGQKVVIFHSTLIKQISPIGQQVEIMPFRVLHYYNYDANYAKGKNSWKNKIILGYGLQYLADDYKKTEDKIDLSSLYGYEIKAKWDASLLLFLKTQFVEGFDGDNDSVYVSKFMAPGYNWNRSWFYL